MGYDTVTLAVARSRRKTWVHGFIVPGEDHRVRVVAIRTVVKPRAAGWEDRT